MTKKIVVGTLLGSLIVLIGFGLALRFFVPAPLIVNNAAPNANAQGTVNSIRSGGPGQGQAQGQAQGQGAAAQGVEWITLQGSVISVDQYAMRVKAANGEEVRIENRPWAYALEQKFTAQVGDQITMNGFYQNGLYEIGQMQNVTSGAKVQVRDVSGRPGWAGRGNGGGGGYYNGTVN